MLVKSIKMSFFNYPAVLLSCLTCFGSFTARRYVKINFSFDLSQDAIETVTITSTMQFSSFERRHHHMK